MRVSEVPAGQGATGVIDGQPIAVYSAEDGLVVLSNVCTHLGCSTDWNSIDQSWDCPCHGSRYNPDGSVLRGPAPDPLPPLAFHLEDDEIIIDGEVAAEGAG